MCLKLLSISIYLLLGTYWRCASSLGLEAQSCKLSMEEKLWGISDGLHLLIGFIGQLIILFRWLRFENWTPKKKKECFCLPVFRVWSTDGPVVLVLVAPEVLSQSNWSSPVCWVQLQKLLSKSQSVGRPVPVSSKKSMRCCLNHDSRIQTRGNRLVNFPKSLMFHLI